MAFEKTMATTSHTAREAIMVRADRLFHLELFCNGPRSKLTSNKVSLFSLRKVINMEDIVQLRPGFVIYVPPSPSARGIWHRKPLIGLGFHILSEKMKKVNEYCSTYERGLMRGNQFLLVYPIISIIFYNRLCLALNLFLVI